MKRISKPLNLLVLLLLIMSCDSNTKVTLNNGKDLENWDIFVSDPEVGPGDVFWVEDGMIHTSGKPHSYIRTKEQYSNFKLHVEWKWIEEPTNSGVLIHVQGEDLIWPLCIECQLKHENAGDIVLIGKGSGITVDGTKHLVTSEENRYEVVAKSGDVSENPAGEWNSYDITSVDGNIEVVVNGILQNTGTDMTLTSGNIGLQSEGSPMQFRNVYLEPL